MSGGQHVWDLLSWLEMCGHDVDREIAHVEMLREEMAGHFTPLRGDRLDRNAAFQARRDTIWQEMDRFSAEQPEFPAVLVKARLYELIAEHFEPVLFPHCPFFFEMGVRRAENWGVPDGMTVASWMRARREPHWRDPAAHRGLEAYQTHTPDRLAPLWGVWGVFDVDHHCVGYTRLFQVGIRGVLADIEARRREPTTEEQAPFLEAAERGARAMVRIARRFADKALEMLPAAPDAQASGFLSLIAKTAARVPYEPPRTFHEGLAALLFLREVTGSIDGIGVSVLGHLDRHLIDLYRADVAAGRLTEAEAKDLLARWMVQTDVRFHVEDNPWPETSTCIELGGCDAEGRPLFNEVTRLVIEAHREHGLVNPKLNCRIAADSPDAYLRLLAGTLLTGHNNFAFLNDDVLIPANVRMGKSVEEARRYVNGGCQETMVEGVEHSAGAHFYFNLAEVMALSLQPLAPDPAKSRFADLAALAPSVIEQADSFESFYLQFMSNVERVLRRAGGWIRAGGRQWQHINPCPWFSATLDGCIESARDYTGGGARHNVTGVAINGLGTVVDSLQAIRAMVFESRSATLREIRDAVRLNWEGTGNLRLRMAALPKYGHGDRDTDELAARLARDISAVARSMRNERDGPFQPSFFVYYQFKHMGDLTPATPDGRRDGEMLSQGITPARVRPPEAIPSIFEALGRVDFVDYAGNGVLDMQLPAGGRFGTDQLVALMRVFVQKGGPTLQVNCVSAEDLRDAKLHPEQHGDLVVRISGLSARFVSLDETVQDEIIARTVYAA